MSSSLQRRVENLEATTEFKDESNRLKIVMGYIQHLPPEYRGHSIWLYATGCFGAAWEAASTSGKKSRGQRRRITRQAAWANYAPGVSAN
jgi:hypothetical protein